MKRSEMLAHLETALLITTHIPSAHLFDISEEILSYLEKKGLTPPTTQVQNIKGKDYRWGGGCTMRCNCEDCNPKFLVSEWEPEDDAN